MCTVNDLCDGSYGDLFLFVSLGVISVKRMKVKSSKHSILIKHPQMGNREGNFDIEER